MRKCNVIYGSVGGSRDIYIYISDNPEYNLMKNDISDNRVRCGPKVQNSTIWSALTHTYFFQPFGEKPSETNRCEP